MKHPLLVLAVSIELASCQHKVDPVIDLSKAEWQWSCPDSSTLRPFNASMPGHVLEALVEADLTPNPYLGTHERDVQWVETVPWHLRAHIPNTGVDADSAVMCLEGIDTY
ncbi:MAG: hypothetical protein VX758_02980, partial [Bacteroidota bacterium]|nr:hypothetical protein [Bacteroidota bacterium]